MFSRYLLDVTGEDVGERSQDRIDALRNDLTKMARQRLKGGSDIKTELLFIDVVRLVEKIGDYAFSISEAIRVTR
jgi:phosphate:Na+ symporter